MDGLLHDKSDARIDNDNLRKINDWAYKHSKFCPMMASTIKGYSSMIYTIEYCKSTDSLSYGCCCQCGMGMILSNNIFKFRSF